MTPWPCQRRVASTACNYISTTSGPSVPSARIDTAARRCSRRPPHPCTASLSSRSSLLPSVQTVDPACCGWRFDDVRADGPEASWSDESVLDAVAVVSLSSTCKPDLRRRIIDALTTPMLWRTKRLYGHYDDWQHSCCFYRVGRNGLSWKVVTHMMTQKSVQCTCQTVPFFI